MELLDELTTFLRGGGDRSSVGERKELWISVFINFLKFVD